VKRLVNVLMKYNYSQYAVYACTKLGLFIVRDQCCMYALCNCVLS